MILSSCILACTPAAPSSDHPALSRHARSMRVNLANFSDDATAKLHGQYRYRYSQFQECHMLYTCSCGHGHARQVSFCRPSRLFSRFQRL